MPSPSFAVTRVLCFVVCCAPLVSAQSTAPATQPTDELTAAEQAELSRHFGFGPMDIHKLDFGISNLHVGDLNRDGLKDFVIANNRRSRIEVFYQRQTPQPATIPAGKKDDVNALVEPGRFRKESVAVSYAIVAMSLADVTGDGILDIVFFGNPPELVIVPGLDEGGFDTPRGIRVSEAVTRPNALATGDLNNDGRPDIALLGERNVLVFLQDEDGALQRPALYSHGGSGVGLIFIIDLDGDGRKDVVLAAGNTLSIAARLQQPNGRLGPQVRFEVPDVRSLTPGPMPNQPGVTALYGIESRGGRLKRYVFEREPQTSAVERWPVLLFAHPFETGQTSPRPLDVGDINGDGLPDVVAADPDSAQAVVYLQVPELGLDAGKAFPSLMKVRDVRIVSLRGTPAVLSFSREEKSIGIARYENGRLTFPVAIRATGEPLGADYGVLSPGGPERLVYLTKQDDKLTLHVTGIGDDPATTQPVTTFEVPGSDGTPAAIRLVDVDQDGRQDVLVFTPFEPLTTLLQKEDGTFEALPTTEEVGRSLVRDVKLSGFAIGDVTGDGKPEVLVAQKAFARALRIQNGRWTVVDQFNAPGSRADVTAVAVLPGNASQSVVALYDRGPGEVHALRRDGTAYQVATSVPVGNFDVVAFAVAKLAGSDATNLLIADNQGFAVTTPFAQPPTLKTTAEFESPIEDAFLADTTVGDLNSDGVLDIAAIESSEGFIEMLTTAPDGDIIQAGRFRVFEQKSFRPNFGGGGVEPREFQIADLTGDGRNDLIVVVHDRVILYPGQ